MPGTLPTPSLILVEDKGFDVRGVDGGQALNQALLERRADVLILDLNMAEEDGISIAKRMRITSPEVGIVMLTARVQSIDKQNGYQSGADVYMTKPARPAELVAALRNLLARLAPQVKQTQWILDTTLLSIRFQQTTSIALTIAEAKLLKTLALNNACVELEELQLVLDHQSEDAAKNKLRLEVLISRLRSKLSPYMGEFNPIKSVRGRGYQLCMPLAIE